MKRISLIKRVLAGFLACTLVLTASVDEFKIHASETEESSVEQSTMEVGINLDKLSELGEYNSEKGYGLVTDGKGHSALRLSKGSYVLTQTSTTSIETNIIVEGSDNEVVTLTLKGIKIDAGEFEQPARLFSDRTTGTAAISVQGNTTCKLILASDTSNEFKGHSVGNGNSLLNTAAISVENAYRCNTSKEDGEVFLSTLIVEADDTNKQGKLVASGSACSSAIGGNDNRLTGNIIINSGIVEATSGAWAPGIGDGDTISSSNSGGDVKRWYWVGDTNGSYLGTASNAYNCNQAKIQINGGTINAKSQNATPAIGTADKLSHNESGVADRVWQGLIIEINGGNITALAQYTSKTAAIGSGTDTLMDLQNIIINQSGNTTIVAATCSNSYAIVNDSRSAVTEQNPLINSSSTANVLNLKFSGAKDTEKIDFWKLYEENGEYDYKIIEGFPNETIQNMNAKVYGISVILPDGTYKVTSGNEVIGEGIVLSGGGMLNAQQTATGLQTSLPPTIVSQPVNQTVMYSQAASFSVEANAQMEGTLSYQWQVSMDGISWNDISNGTAATLTVDSTDANAQEKMYRCVVSEKDSSNVTRSSTTHSVQIQVWKPAAPQNQTVTAGQPVTFTTSVPENVTGVYHYNWQYSQDGVNWENVTYDIAENGNAALVISNPNVNLSGYKFRCEVTEEGKTGTEATEDAVLLVNDSLSLLVSGTERIYEGKSVSLQAVVSGGTADYTYNWYCKDENGNWILVEGANGASLEIENLMVSQSYKVVVTDASGAAIESEKTIMVDAYQSVTVSGTDSLVSGQTASLSAPVSNGKGPFTYTWMSSEDGVTWTTIEGADADTLEVSPNSSTIYRVIVTDTSNDDPSTNTTYADHAVDVTYTAVLQVFKNDTVWGDSDKHLSLVNGNSSYEMQKDNSGDYVLSSIPKGDYVIFVDGVSTGKVVSVSDKGIETSLEFYTTQVKDDSGKCTTEILLLEGSSFSETISEFYDTKEENAAETNQKPAVKPVSTNQQVLETSPVQQVQETSPVTNYSNGNITTENFVTTVFAGNVDASVDNFDEAVRTLLTKEEQQRVAAGEKVNIKLEANSSEVSLSKKEQEAVDAVLEQLVTKQSGVVVGTYINISLNKKVGNDTWSVVSGADQSVQVVLTVPEEVKNSTGRYFIIRLSNGTCEVYEDVDNNPDTITFATDDFTSTYAIVTIDEQADATPLSAGNKIDNDDISNQSPNSSKEETGKCFWHWLTLLCGVCYAVVDFIRKKMKKDEDEEDKTSEEDKENKKKQQRIVKVIGLLLLLTASIIFTILGTCKWDVPCLVLAMILGILF